MSKLSFPKGFLWGAATSSHQVEGGNVNDWSKWEDAGHVKHQQKSGVAADYWNRYEQDFDLLNKLKLNSYRLSIEWSRIEPEKGKFDKDALAHYREMLLALRKRNIEPVVTLHHFTNPLWLEDWTHEQNVKHFSEYVVYVVEQLGDLVRYWCTINEPMNVVLLAYAGDIWPPQHKSFSKGLAAMKVFMKAHKQAYDDIHAIYEKKDWGIPLVGIPITNAYFKPASRNPLNVGAAKLLGNLRNHYFLKRISHKLDFIGLNHYHVFHVRWNSIKSFTWIDNPELRLPKNDMGWNMEPKGIFSILLDLKERYDLPIMITENGLADKKDTLRKWFILSTLQQVHGAIEHGAHVIGYLHWSLIDNFEWAEGYDGRFGLVAVDFDTQERTIRDSALVYAEIAKQNALPEDMEISRP